MLKPSLLTVALVVAVCIPVSLTAGGTCGLIPCQGDCDTCSDTGYGDGCGDCCDNGFGDCYGGSNSGCCDSCSSQPSCCISELLKQCCLNGCCLSGSCASNRCNSRYTSLFGAYNSLHDYSGGTPIPGPLTSGSFSDGWGVGFAQGRSLYHAFRGEFEFAFRNNTGDDWTVNGVTSDWSGHVRQYAGMANLFLDLNSLRFHGTTPYLGAGIGFAIFNGHLRTDLTKIEIGDEALAYQFIAGVSHQVAANIDFFAEYRHFSTTDLDVYNVGVNPRVLLDSTPGEMESVILGLRFYR